MGDHVWKPKYYKSFKKCGICKELLWGVTTKQGYKCQQCKLIAHESCRSKAQRPCPKGSNAPSTSASSSSSSRRELSNGPSSTSALSSSSQSLAPSSSKKAKRDKESSSEERSSATEVFRRSKSKGKSTGSGFDEARLIALFNEYKSKSDEVIDALGVMGFIHDLELEPEDPVLLVMCYYLKAKVMGEFAREEFVDGFKQMKVDSLEKIIARIPQWREELKDPKKLREVFDYAFDFYKESPDKKTIDNETAVATLGLLIPTRTHVKEIRSFLREKKATYKGINYDQWASIFDFTLKVDTDFFPYDPDIGEYPLLIDEFVDWARGESKEEPSLPMKRVRNEDSDEDL